MNTSTHNDGWTTVGARGSGGAGRAVPPPRRPAATPMPAAFGGRPKGRFHTDNGSAYAGARAAEAAEKAATERAAEKRRMDALKFDDATEYPSLGVYSRMVAPPPKSALNFKMVVEATAARDAAAAAEEALWRAREEREMLHARLAAASEAQRRRALIGTRCFDDGPDDYDGGDDDEEYRGYEGEETLGTEEYAPPAEMAVAEEYARATAADADADFNADLYRDRRLGDKGVW